MPAHSPRLGSVCTEPTGYWWVVCSSRLSNQYGAQSLLLLAQIWCGKDGFRMARAPRDPYWKVPLSHSLETENFLVNTLLCCTGWRLRIQVQRRRQRKVLALRYILGLILNNWHGQFLPMIIKVTTHGTLNLWLLKCLNFFHQLGREIQVH